MTIPVWLNGVLVEPEDATVTIFDHGITVGDGCFETMRLERGAPLAITRHLRRLRRSLDGLGLSLTRSDAELRAASEAIAARIDGPGKIRITVTGGIGPMGSGRDDGAELTTYITGAPLDPWPPTAATLLVPWRRNEHSPITGVKSTSYAENVVALAEAKKAGASEALFANTAGQLCEGTGSNVFVVHGDVVSTPWLLSGCLAGITRELVLEIAPDVREENLGTDALDTADEVFLTSSTRDVQGVDVVNGRALDAPGPQTQRIAAAFAALVASTTDP